MRKVVNNIEKKILFLIFISLFWFTLVSAERLPIVNGDSDNWGTIINGYLTKLAGANATFINTGNITIPNATNLSFYNSTGSEKLILTQDGNLGIGETNPQQRLVVNGDLNITSGNLTLGNKITFRLGEIIDNLIDGWITITGGLNVTDNLEVAGTSTFSGGDLSVNTNDLYVDVSTQRVGINTASPSTTLDVNGILHADSGDYSTSETDTGQKWVDGKTIYRKVYPVPDLTSVGGSLPISLGMTVDTPLNIGGFVPEQLGNDKIFIGSGVGDIGGTESVSAEIRSSGTELYLDANNNFDWKAGGYVWIEYTR
jgi:hypothetical protein